MSANDYTPATWAVEYQNEKTEVTAANTVVDGYEVTFTTGQGHTGTVFIDARRYTPANVKAAIQDKADLLDHIGNLTHES